MGDRLDWIDIAKGVGIILVVVGHAGRGLMRAGLPDPGALLPALDRIIYAFHMPLFFVLAGITFGLRPPAAMHPGLTRRAWRLLYALVVWTYAFLAMRALAGSSANAGGAWEDLLVWPLPPFAHFWFLWALLLNMLAFGGLRLALSGWIAGVRFWALALAGSLAAHFLLPVPPALAPFIGEALAFGPVFTLGALIGASSLARQVPRWSTAALGAVLFAFGLWVGLQAAPGAGPPWAGVLPGALLALCLLLPLAAVAARAGGTAWARGLAFLGVISLAIFVMHTMFSAALRILLLKLGVTDLALHLTLGTLVGVIGPLLAYLAARRMGLRRLAGLA